jgi:hypothetical protein
MTVLYDIAGFITAGIPLVILVALCAFPGILIATVERKKHQHSDAVKTICAPLLAAVAYDSRYLRDIIPGFRIGQRVRFTDVVGERSWWFKPGQTGIVVSMDGLGALPIDVEVDDANGDIAHVRSNMIEPLR